MSVEQRIRETLEGALNISHLEVTNESGMHKVPPGSESHFRVVVVADEFESDRLVQRHRRVNSLLGDFFAAGLHALAIHAFTPAEWQARSEAAPPSPPCRGGSVS